jgi:hypothetical protein
LSAPLLEQPAQGSRTLFYLREGMEVSILKEAKGWLEVELSSDLKGRKGWVQTRYVRVHPAPPPEKSSSPRKPIRLLFLGGYAWGAKDFPGQFRGGIDVLYAAWQATEIGLDVEAGFQDATVISAAPILVQHLSWPRARFLQAAVFGGFPVVFVSQGGTDDTLFGVKVGLDLTVPIGRSGKTKFDLTARVAPELLLFGSSRVSIPLLTALGLSIRF